MQEIVEFINANVRLRVEQYYGALHPIELS